MNIHEIWKPIAGYEGLYEVSNMGRVKGLKRGKILSPLKTRKGYLEIELCKKGKRKRFKIHRLVYSAFNGEIPAGLQVNHINDKDKTDNRLCNLNLMTPKENINWGTCIQRRSKARSKSVIAYDKQGNFVREFDSLKETSEWLGKPRAHCNVWHNLKGNTQSAYGYIWKYKD